MAEQILLHPTFPVCNAELFLSINIKVVRACAIQKDIFCVQYFESACNIVVLKSQKIALSKGKLLLFRIVYYFFNIFISIGAMFRKSAKHNNSRNGVYAVFINSSLSRLIQKNSIFRVILPQSIHRPNSSCSWGQHVQNLQKMMNKRTAFGVIDQDINLGLKQILEKYGRSQFFGCFFKLLFIDD